MARLLFTARAGGKSEGEFDSLNLAQHVGDQSDIVQVNRHELMRLLSVKQLQLDRKSTSLNSSHVSESRMPSSA